MVIRADASVLDRAWSAVHSVLDPEVPALSVVDLGIVRDVRVTAGGGVTVHVTPTYSGCPAMRVIEREIQAALRVAGFDDPRVVTVYQPPWSSDWITEEGRRRLREYGIAPPGPRPDDSGELVPLRRPLPSLECPFCASRQTERKSEFGSTACKALWFCHGCRQPFEEFKAI
jgi:ring-1,2-phenylacetyl-CoA epoxidase subunit PaaD